MNVPKNNKCRGIADRLHREIASGKITGKAPSENAIAERFGISKATAAKVLAILRDADIIETVVGSGSYIRSRAKTITIAVQTDFERIRGIEPSITEHLKARFPGVTFRFTYERGGAGDIATLVSHPVGRYQDIYQPLPEAMVKRITKRLVLPGGMAELHTREACYALPFTVSPTFIMFNRIACERFGISASFFEDDYPIIAERIAAYAQDIAPFDLTTMHLKDLMPFMLSGEKRGEPTAADIARGTERFQAAVLSHAREGASILDGSALCKIGSRMLPAVYGTRTNGYDPAIAPIRVNGKPVNMLHSQSLAVQKNAADPVLASLVVEEFYSDAVQRIIGESGFGLSVTGAKARADDAAARSAREMLEHSRWRYFSFDHAYMPLAVNFFFLFAAGKINAGDLSGLITSLMTLMGNDVGAHGE